MRESRALKNEDMVLRIKTEAVCDQNYNGFGFIFHCLVFIQVSNLLSWIID